MRSSVFWLERNVPACLSNWSTRVVLPWSTWAMMAMLRILSINFVCLHDEAGTDYAGMGPPCQPVECKKVGFVELLQLEIDIHGVAISRSQTSRQGVDARDALERLGDRSVHHRIAAALDNLGTGNRAVLEDLDFNSANKRFVLLENGGGLLPLAEEAVVDEFVIPPELARCTACGSLARSTGRCALAIARGAGFCVGLGGGFCSFAWRCGRFGRAW